MTNTQRINELYDILSRGCAWRTFFDPPRIAEKPETPHKRNPPTNLKPEKYAQPACEIIAQHLRAHGDCTALDIAKATTVKYSTVRTTLFDMRVAGQVQPVGSLKTRKWRLVA